MLQPSEGEKEILERESDSLVHFLIFLPARRKEKEDNWLAGEKWRKWQENANISKYFLNLRTSDIHLFYNLQLFYWHFLEILWLFIFLVFYRFFQKKDK